jgi:metal-responsive CopG/Arc/MetJ family transcriptional regulator
MRTVTLHLPEPIIQIVDKMVRIKLYRYRNTALRFIIQRGLKEHMKLLSILDGGKSNDDNPVKKFTFDDDDMNMTLISLKIPKGLLALMKMDMEKKGIRKRAEYIRLAIMNFIMDSMKQE